MIHTSIQISLQCKRFTPGNNGLRLENGKPIEMLKERRPSYYSARYSVCLSLWIIQFLSSLVSYDYFKWRLQVERFQPIALFSNQNNRDFVAVENIKYFHFILVTILISNYIVDMRCAQMRNRNCWCLAGEIIWIWMTHLRNCELHYTSLH